MLDVGPTTPLSCDAWLEKRNVRPRNKRAPTAAHLRARQHAAETEDDVDDAAGGDKSVAAVEQPEDVSCRGVFSCCAEI